jgi:hypothetical protein
MGIDLQITYDSTYWNRTCVYGSYMTRPRYIVGLGMEAMNWTNSINYKELSKDFKLPCHCPICEDLDDVYGFFNNYKMEDGEEVIMFKKFNNMIAFHNLYLQLEYLENVRRIFSSGMKDVYEAFFPKRICDNFTLIDDYFNNVDNEKCDALLNKKFLSGYVEFDGVSANEKDKIIKDSKGSKACGLGI